MGKTWGSCLVLSFLMAATAAWAEETTGVASYYGSGERLNHRTAMNLPFNPALRECASWHFPLGSVLQVTSLRTGKSVVVRCTDRGPAKRLNRLIDLTADAFSEIEDPRRGLAKVEVKRVG